MVFPEIEKAAKGLSKFIDSSKNIAIFFDDDVDGITSEFLFEKFLKSKGIDVQLRLHYDEECAPFSSGFNKKLELNNIDLLVFLDFSIGGFGYFDNYKVFVKENPEFKVITIDHHKSEMSYEINENTLEINASKLQDKIIGEQYCTAKLIYDLCESIKKGSLVKYDWVVLVGIIGDHCQTTWSEFALDIINNFNGKNNDEKEIIIPKEEDDYYLTPFGQVSNSLFFGISKGVEEVDLILKDLSSVKDVFKLKKLLKRYDGIKSEVYDYIDNYDFFVKQHAPVDGKLNVFEVEISSNNNIETIVANLISSKNPEMIFFVYHETKQGFIHISSRLQSRSIDLGALFTKVSSYFEDAKGGGHEAAAGALVSKGIFKEFKDAFYQELKTIEMKNEIGGKINE